MENHPDMGLVSIEAGVPRSIEHIIAETPEIEELSHRVICPPLNVKGNKRKSFARIMAEKSMWILYPRTHRN